MYQRIIKPFFDKLVAAMGLVISVPVMVPVIILLYISNNGKVWFTQPRPGYKGAIFYVLKFKTMNDRCDANGNLLSDAERLTAAGKFVRKTSLDEIPQLINVLKGDMSIVGPRPLLVEYLPLYDNEQQRRHNVKPGITGWAQVNGRNAIAWEQKFIYDVWYVDHLSFWIDIKILFLTIFKVFKAEGVSSNTSVTIDRFRGSR